MRKQRANSGKVKTSFIFFMVAVFIAAIFLVAYFFPPRSSELVYESVKTENPRLNYVETPEAVRGVYMTSCIASHHELRGKLVKSLEGTKINTIIIDIKDYSGTISIPTVDASLKTDASRGCHYEDAAAFIKELHDKKYYVIGRISVFQDPYYAAKHPEMAVQKKSDGSIWRDRKGLAFIDVSARPYWEYIVKIGKEGRDIGFDELNFDYIRFPSDGDMTDIAFPWTKDMEKKEALRLFFGYLTKQFRGTGAALSADLFGMTTYATSDMNIGQYLEFALPYFDYVSPMVYPSHYPPQWNGYADPAMKPYEVVKYSMDKAYERASSTPRKLRPWLQDFNLGATYTPEMVKAQMKAVYDSGLNSWMLWSPSNKYTAGALNYARD